MKFKPSPSPSPKAQELFDIHLPMLSSWAWLILLGPTSHAESGFGSISLVGKNQTSSNPKKICFAESVSNKGRVGKRKPFPSGIAVFAKDWSSGLFCSIDDGSKLLSRQVINA